MRDDGPADLRAWGVDPGYEDVRGEWHAAPPATLRAVLDQLGAEPVGDGDDVRPGRRPPEASTTWVVREGEAAPAEGRWSLRLEDGGTAEGHGALPADLPLGYHALHLDEEGRDVLVVVSPGRCHPAPEKAWGWALQLYALRSGASWGMGDLGDLDRFTRWAADLGAEVTVLNPLHASMPVGPQQPSPYSPASRVFRNPIYLRPELVEGADGLGLRAPELGGDRVDRDAVWEAKRPALEAAFGRWRERGDRSRLEAYQREVGPALERWAAFCAAAEAAGPDWRSWPSHLRTPEAAVASVAGDAALADRATFHAWLQWQVDEQLAAAGSHGVGLVQDLAIGCDAGGADAWLWERTFADGMRVGAPPDVFNPDGQDWGLPPFDPWKLREAGFGPFIDIVRAGLRHAGGLRVDHVMGLFRLWWIPLGSGAGEGTYVRYPWRELLDVLALESVRAGAFVVGEDLGTVEDGVREELADRRVLSTRLVWFEDERPGPAWPEQAMAAVTTHDLPTVAGVWTGADVEDQQAAGVKGAEEAVGELRTKLAGWAGLDEGAPVDEAVRAAHRLLAQAPSRVVTATLDDALRVELRPNLPGTVDERPNWRLPLPAPLEELESDPFVREVAQVLRDR